MKSWLPLTVSLAAGGAALVGCRDTAAPFAPIPARIAFVSDRRLGQSDIWLMNTDGSLQLVTDHLAQDDWRSWSPDGTHLDSNDATYVMNADGTHAVNVTHRPAADDGPAWSPDGTKIAFYSDRDGSDFAIYVMNANGSGVVRLTSTTVHHELPAWSPDGQYIAFDSDADIYMMKADGTGLRRLTSGNAQDFMPRWQPW